MSSDQPGQRDSLRAPPLAEAKLAAPALRAAIVTRARVQRTLDQNAPLTLVAAPPGYGKSTAVRAWCAAREVPLAWVSLDDGDNDPVRFWRYIATAISRTLPEASSEAIRRLAVSGAPVGVALDELANGIAAAGRPLVLVLDDLQHVTNADCLQSLDYFVAALPDHARMIAISRANPALRLAGLRAHGSLVELRADQLAFTTEEARRLLVELGRLELDEAEVALLVRRTEGWPAAMVMAAVWLGRVDEPRLAIRRFGADHRYITEYLSNEVLDSLVPDLRDALLRISVLGSFTAELCDFLLDRSDAAALLGELEHANLFITRLARSGWFRAHSLFADFATLRLDAEAPGTSTELHRRAASWLHQRGLPVEAAEHAGVAGDFELIAEILGEGHLSLIRTGAERTVIRWVRRVPDDLLVEHPELAAAAATAATIVGGHALERARLLGTIERTERERPELLHGYTLAVRDMVVAAAVDDDVTAAIHSGARAVATAEAAADEALVAALAGHARALYFAGELDRSWTLGMRAIEHPEAERRVPGQALARTTLALVAIDQGRLSSARGHAAKAKQLTAGTGISHSWLGANAAVALGALELADDNLVEAEQELELAERFFADQIPTVHYAWLLVLLARVRCRRGRLDEARDTLHGAQRMIAQLIDCGRVVAMVAEAEQELIDARARATPAATVRRPSAAELAVLELLASDLSTREIGDKLFLSLNTVRSHTRSIYRKLGVTSREDAVARATASGMLGVSIRNGGDV